MSETGKVLAVPGKVIIALLLCAGVGVVAYFVTRDSTPSTQTYAHREPDCVDRLREAEADADDAEHKLKQAEDEISRLKSELDDAERKSSDAETKLSDAESCARTAPDLDFVRITCF